MNEQTGAFSSNIVDKVEVPTGRIAAWLYKRALRQRIEAHVSPGVERTPSGISTYHLELGHKEHLADAERVVGIVVDLAKTRGLFASATRVGDTTFDVLLEGQYETLRRFVVDFFYRTHLAGEIA